MTKQPGLPGQNSPDPESVFTFHEITFINNTYYDPSYGLTYASLDQMTQEDVAGFFRVVSDVSHTLAIQKRAASGELLVGKAYGTYS